ncbi:MAG TPA: ABC transporter permease [Lacunisphaera sp.]|jgi:predicted permease
MPSLRFAIRSLIKSPSYTLIALVTLALGIGVNTSMFSIVDALLFRSAPYPEPDNLVQVMASTRQGDMRNFSDLEIREIHGQAAAFSSLTTLGHSFYAMAEPGRPAERLHAVCFSQDMMDTFRTEPLIGRTFSRDEFEPGKNQVILLSEDFWQSRFGGDRGIIGHTVRLDGEPVTIIGVMPERFNYRFLWGNVALWRPLNFTRDQSTIRSYRGFTLIGRLKANESPAGAGAQLSSVAVSQEKNFPKDYPGMRYRVVILHEALMDDVSRGISWMLLGLSGFVLLIACANLANLQLARTTVAMKEFAIRAALGASRARLLAEQLMECIVLSLAGGILGFVVTLWVNSLLENAILIDGAHGFKASMNGAVLGVALLVSLLSGIVFGVVPAFLVSRTDVNTTLKQQSRGSTGGRGQHRMRNALIICEVALALILLGGAAVMNRGFQKFLNRETGWDTSHVLTGVLPMPEVRFDTPEKRIAFYRSIESKLTSLPGVEKAALSSSLPLFNYSSDRPVFTDVPAAGQSQGPSASHVMITPSYFAAMGIPVLAGHDFPPDIKAGDAQVIVVNEALAKKFWPHDSAVGKRLGVFENNQTVWREVIGVVRDVQSAANFTNGETRLQVYRPLVQEPWSYVNLVVRSESPGALADTVRRAVSEVDPDLPADQVATVRQFVDRTQHNLIVVGQMLIGFALLGLALAAVGLYGVISNLVAQRTTEFGIRLALGAQSGDILGDVLRRGLRLAFIGLALGLIGAYALARFLGSIMPRLATPDPIALAEVSLLLFIVTLVACWLPARRATKVDPMVALRAE